jgi:hypothetical protein
MIPWFIAEPDVEKVFSHVCIQKIGNPLFHRPRQVHLMDTAYLDAHVQGEQFKSNVYLHDNRSPLLGSWSSRWN